MKILQEMGTMMTKKMNYWIIARFDLRIWESGREGPPPFHKKLGKIFQALLWGVFKKEKLEKLEMDTVQMNNLPKQIKDISEINEVAFAISKKSFTPSSNISIPHHKIPQNLAFFFVGKLESIKRKTSVHAEWTASISSKIFPSKIEESIKISNEKFKAEITASCLSKWKEITSDKWILNTVSGANIEYEDIYQIPLSQRKSTKYKINSDIFGQELENLL